MNAIGHPTPSEDPGYIPVSDNNHQYEDSVWREQEDTSMKWSGTQGEPVKVEEPQVEREGRTWCCKNPPCWCWMIIVLLLLGALTAVLVLMFTRDSPEGPKGEDYDGCLMSTVMHTTSHLPPTRSGGSVIVECASGATLPGGQTKYNATCNLGTWNLQQSCAFRDCKAAHDKGQHTSGVYKISPDGNVQMDVYCEQELSGGGWTLIQRRMNGHISFFRNWADYNDGFGNITGDFWLGNENIYMLTSRRDQKLKIEMIHPNKTLVYANYLQFWIEEEIYKYQLFISGFSSTPVLNNTLAYHNGSKFTTKDQDNDLAVNNCAQINYGGWWYKSCQFVNLNGPYNATSIRGIRWSGFTKNTESLINVRMMIKTA